MSFTQLPQRVFVPVYYLVFLEFPHSDLEQ